MIYWEALKYDINQAIKDYEGLRVEKTELKPINPRSEYVPIRKELIRRRDELFDKHHLDYMDKLEYEFDLLFGIELYEVLNASIGFNNRIANNDDVWRYLSICVIPDVVHSRWGLNESRFYKDKRRIWLKTIWWYIHLSWCKDKGQTYNILKNNTTDTIVQLVERPNLGYYVDLYRELMYQYSYLNDSSRETFRRAMKINTARLVITSPELVDGGLPQYVKDLFNDAKKQE